MMINAPYPGYGGGWPYPLPNGGQQPPQPVMNQQMVPFVPIQKEEAERPRPNILQFMREFNDRNRQPFNPYWFERNDKDIIDGIEKVILSCQRDKYFTLRVVSFNVIEDYEEIQRLLHRRYANRKKNGKKIENPYDYINMRDSDIMLLVVHYYIKINRPEDQIRMDPKTKEPEKLEGEEEVLICLPRYVNKYYFRIQGNYYAPMFQIVDGSTYNNCTSTSKAQVVKLKTRFMPVTMYREYPELIDVVTGESFKCCYYTTYIFRKKVDAMKYLLGRYGIYGTLELLEINHIQIGREPMMDPAIFLNFLCSDKVTVVSVPKQLFESDPVTQSFVYTMTKYIHKYEDWKEIFDPRFWNKSLGGDFMAMTLDKGIPVLDSLESIYDIRTRENIRLPEEDKCDVYHILRWMMREFGALRMKDNLDISTKKARMAGEYIDCLYAMKLSKAIYRISDKGKSVKYRDVFRAINIAPDYILTVINSSNLVSYVNAVNDNDADLALEHTYKGISGLGDQGSGSSVPIIYRTVHPSHIGRVDLDASSASDPGLSGNICPMAEVYDGSFSDYQEPNGWKDKYRAMLSEFHQLTGIVQATEIKQSLGLSFDYIKDDMVRETLENYQKIIPGLVDLNTKIDYMSSYTTNKYVAVKGMDGSGIGDITVEDEDDQEDDSELKGDV